VGQYSVLRLFPAQARRRYLLFEGEVVAFQHGGQLRGVHPIAFGNCIGVIPQ
jgi:hypothetical protein